MSAQVRRSGLSLSFRLAWLRDVEKDDLCCLQQLWQHAKLPLKAARQHACPTCWHPSISILKISSAELAVPTRSFKTFCIPLPQNGEYDCDYSARAYSNASPAAANYSFSVSPKPPEICSKGIHGTASPSPAAWEQAPRYPWAGNPTRPSLPIGLRPAPDAHHITPVLLLRQTDLAAKPLQSENQLSFRKEIEEQPTRTITMSRAHGSPILSTLRRLTRRELSDKSLAHLVVYVCVCILIPLFIVAGCGSWFLSGYSAREGASNRPKSPESVFVCPIHSEFALLQACFLEGVEPTLP